MRKHDVRKWLHAILDLLPVILIPVFMIYSHRHTIDSGSIEVPQKEVVDFNQLAYTRSLEFGADDYQQGLPSSFPITTNFTFTTDHIYYFKLHLSVPLTSNIRNTFYFDNEGWQFLGSISSNYQGNFSLGDTTNANINNTDFYFVITSDVSSVGELGYWCAQPDVDVVVFDFQIFDLTQMFGSGNEPTIVQFNNWYTLSYYEYTLSHKELLIVGNTTYNDTDIMSQATYQLYNAVDKYFNMGNVFNLGNVYDWFNLNIFNGNSPIAIYIVWNIVLYEFVMDLLFLLYGLFMWFIDMVEKLMEKPINSVR